MLAESGSRTTVANDTTVATDMLAESGSRTALPTDMLAESGSRTALPKCQCGTDRTRREATPEREYTFLGALYALWGGTSVPSRVNFRCVHCGVVFDGASDVATRREFIV